MKKNISIELGGKSFLIEEEAYSLLSEHIDKYETFFAEEPQREEVIEEIERKIADYLDDKMRFGLTTVRVFEIEEAIELVGLPENYVLAEEAEEVVIEEETEKKESKPEAEQEIFDNPSGRKHLYRDVHNRIIGGVAAGIANYLETDVSIIRIILLALCIFSIPVVILYLIAWLILTPEPRQTAQKQKSQSRYIKKIFRLPQQGMLGGVAAGLADYLTWNVTLVRFLWVIAALPWSIFNPYLLFINWFGAVSIPAYFVLWVILPAHRAPGKQKEKNEPQPGETGAQTFAQTMQQEKEERVTPPLAKGLSTGAGIVAGGCGCFLLILSIPILLLILIPLSTVLSSNFNYLAPHFQEILSFSDLLNYLAPSQQLIFAIALSLFAVITLFAVTYAVLRAIFGLRKLSKATRIILLIFWILSTITLIVLGQNIFFGIVPADFSTVQIHI